MTGDHNRDEDGKESNEAVPDELVPEASDQSDDYEVGYGKPPKSTRFKPGQSGNPKGRKKKQPTVPEQIDTLLKQKVTVNEGGKRKRLSRQQVMLTTVANNAAKGDLKSISFLLNLQSSHANSTSPQIDPKIVDDENRAVLEDFIEQLNIGELVQDTTDDDDADSIAEVSDETNWARQVEEPEESAAPEEPAPPASSGIPDLTSPLQVGSSSTVTADKHSIDPGSALADSQQSKVAGSTGNEATSLATAYPRQLPPSPAQPEPMPFTPSPIAPPDPGTPTNVQVIRSRNLPPQNTGPGNEKQ